MILSLCTGYGGLDLAVEAATGLPTCAVSDVDKGARLILGHRFHDVPNIGDLTLHDFTRWAGIATVLTAGYPCQPFSAAGKRKGEDDPRHLFPHIARAIGEIRPELVVLENVRGHLTLGLPTVLGSLAGLGYDARWVLVPASDVGAPHQRLRLFIVAEPAAADADHQRGQGPGRRHGAPRVDESALDGAAAADADVQRHGRGQDTREVGRLGSVDEGAARQRQRARALVGTGGNPAAADADDAGRGQQRRAFSAPAQHAAAQRDSTAARFGQYAAAVDRWQNVLGRPAPDPAVDGRLSAAFVEWMMGLPEGWVTDVPGLSRSQQLHALGNGVCPQQAYHALRLLGVAA